MYVCVDIDFFSAGRRGGVGSEGWIWMTARGRGGPKDEYVCKEEGSVKDNFTEFTI